MYRRLLLFITLSAALAVGGSAVALAGNGPLPAELQSVRAALAHYNSVAHAERDGYVPASPCEESAAGAMGIHYLNPSLLGPGIDPLRPELLLYLPDRNGNLKLVGVEYFAVDADQDLATDGDRPSVFGRASWTRTRS